MPREATKTNTSQSNRSSGRTTWTSGKASYSQGRLICPISNSQRAVIWSLRSQIPMEPITSPPSSFSPVRRVEPTSPMARMLTRFFPPPRAWDRTDSQPGRPMFTAVSRPASRAADRVASRGTSGRREASSTSSPWGAFSWPGWDTRKEPRPSTGSPSIRYQMGAPGAGSALGQGRSPRSEARISPSFS